MHFTYNECDKNSLKQGDILKKTPALVALLEEVHPHYNNPEYKYFQVVTQSCDLALRGKKKPQTCASRYVTLAAVRSLADVIDREVEKNAQKRVVINNSLCCSDGHKGQLLEFLRKLFNNNEKNYFFLHESASHGLDEHCCTLLHLTISIRAYQHYDLCLQAKILELGDNFQSKLGWAVGNLYSRVGTDDFVPTAMPDNKDFDVLLNEILEDHVLWVPKGNFADFKKYTDQSTDVDEIFNLVEQRTKERRNARIQNIIGIIKGSIKVDKEEEQNLRNTISQHPTFQKLF